MKLLKIVILFLFPLFVSAQSKEVESYYNSQKKINVYEKGKKFKGPKDWYSSYPSDLDSYYGSEEDELDVSPASPIESVISEEQLNEDRKERYGESYGNGAVKKPKPDMMPPNPIKFPDIDMPDIDLPDVDIPNINLPSFGTWEMWKYILLILVIAIVIFVLYLFIRKIEPRDARVRVDVDDEWNPTVITKTELELKLESAMLSDNFRECVRIHFMFILKELIELNSIDWKLEKTNNDYLNEVRNARGWDAFEECVRIYDLVWYGDYEITQAEYQLLSPVLVNYYQSLQTIHGKKN
jgi:hypothetical protein